MVVSVHGIKFEVDLTVKRTNKKIYIRVRNGIIYMTSPTKLSLFTIEDIILKNYNSIVKVMQEQSKVEDEIHYLGKTYRLVIKDSLHEDIVILDDSFTVYCKSKESIPKLVHLFYNMALKEIVERYATDILFKFEMYDKVTFKYKNVKGYYGECFPKSKVIILSSKLAKYDLKYILSVIYHECAHFKYQNHQEEFYRYLEAVYPNYREVQKELRKIKYKDVY